MHSASGFQRLLDFCSISAIWGERAVRGGICTDVGWFAYAR